MSKAKNRAFIAGIFAVPFIAGTILGAVAFPRTVVETVTETETVYVDRVVEVEKETIRFAKSLGLFECTAYCCENYPHICNDGDATRTATGTRPTPERTIAVDPKVIPYGTEVIINGHTYIAEDTGGAIKGNRVDIVFATHAEAMQFGRQWHEVFVTE